MVSLLNRAVAATLLLYFPIARLGETGSYWEALGLFCVLAIAMVVGANEANIRKAD
jgi:hypothetical protein